MIHLRDYQHDLITRVRESMRAGVRRNLIVLPTGGGKTVLVAQMLKTAAERGHRAAFLVHRKELVEQSIRTFDAVGVEAGVCAANFPSSRRHPIQICSIQTLANRKHLYEPFTLLVPDEAHHSVSASWSSVIASYPGAYTVGCTATPQRLDGRGLASQFDSIIEGPTVRHLIEEEYLCDYKLYAPSAPDLSGIHTRMGDYVRAELSAAMDKPRLVGDAITHYKKLCMGKRAVVFACSIEHSQHVAAQFRSAGITAEHLDGTTHPYERSAIVRRFRSGETKILCNVEIISEGFDLDAIEAVILLRPTKSLAMYLQMVGRALRPMDGKQHAYILDHAGCSMLHGVPDDDREWTLDGRAARTSSTVNEFPVRQCPKCYGVTRAPCIACKHCGYVFPIEARTVEHVEGELAEVDVQQARIASRREQGQAQSLDDLIAIEKARGYKSGWARHVFAARQRRAA